MMKSYSSPMDIVLLQGQQADAALREFWQSDAPAGNDLMFALKNGKHPHTVGYLLATARDGELDVEEVFVREEHQGQGNGSKLVNAVLGYAKERNLRVVRLGSGCGMVAELFKNHGFHHEDSETTLSLRV